uniref:Cytotoxic T lymphocyte-associated protein 2 alpha n=1 Tax=Mus musculus TaxID=10090 RepID=A0A286YCS9_MOUSE
MMVSICEQKLQHFSIGQQLVYVLGTQIVLSSCSSSAWE